MSMEIFCGKKICHENIRLRLPPRDARRGECLELECRLELLFPAGGTGYGDKNARLISGKTITNKIIPHHIKACACDVDIFWSKSNGSIRSSAIVVSETFVDDAKCRARRWIEIVLHGSCACLNFDPPARSKCVTSGYRRWSD